MRPDLGEDGVGFGAAVEDLLRVEKDHAMITHAGLLS